MNQVSVAAVLRNSGLQFKRIWVVEYDSLQLPPLINFLHLAFPAATLVTSTTELGFRRMLPFMIAVKPDLIITESMLPWQWPGETRVVKPFNNETLLSSGLRCIGLLATALPDVPTVAHIMSDPKTLAESIDNEAMPNRFSIAAKHKSYKPLAVSISLAVLGKNYVVDHRDFAAWRNQV